MKPSIQTLGHILYSPSQYVIPVFQRNYRWERPQWEKLWSSLLEIRSPEKRANHFMGFLVFVPGLAQPGQHTTFHLIDGQQRLTTSSILFAAIRNVARRSGQGELADEIHHDYLVHPRKKNDQHYRLLPKERDHDSYVALISGAAEPAGRMADALDYFEEKLLELAADNGEELRSFFDTLCQRFEFMCATLEAENAYNIFKSLNSTGVALGPSDLIRNFVFMHVPPDEQDAFDRSLWAPLEDSFARPDGTLNEDRFSSFFRDFLMAGGRYVAPRDTFPSFEARYEATGFSPSTLARELLDNVRHYTVISGREPDGSAEVSSALEALNALESSTAYPLLLNLFRRRAAGCLSDQDLAQCVRMLSGFIMRRFVCGDSSRGYGQMFVRALAKDADADPVKTLEGYLLERGWPDDHRFESAFVDFPLYQRGYTRQVLDALEVARGHKEPADLRAAQVEHVLPQTLSDAWIAELGPEAERIHADWLHRPGNLTLSAYNQELWNHPFAKKRLRYAQSNIVITRELGSFASWGEDEIRARGRVLAKQAALLWIGPKEEVARPATDGGTDEDTPGRRELRTRFWRGLSDYFVSAYPDLPDFEARPSWTIRVPSGLRHIGFELRYSLRQRSVAIDLRFWRGASLPVWNRIRQAPGPYDEMIGAGWEFELTAEDRARMSVKREGELRDESTWPELYAWLADKLSLVYERVAPKLREEMDRLDKS